MSALVDRTTPHLEPLAKEQGLTARPMFWHLLMVLLVAMALSCGVRWALQHPGPTNWDEAHYFNFIYRDLAGLTDIGVKRLLAGFVYDDFDRPPAYRLLALPVSLVAGPNVAALRVFSILGLAASLALLYGAVWRFSGSRAGAALGVILIAISPQVVEAAAHYGTEVPLYLAIAATLYFTMREWDNPHPSRLSWIGLGLALGAGALAKVTFALFGGPIVLMGIILSASRRVRGPGVAFFLKAAALGSVIALPWWAKNIRAALRFASYSANEYERFDSSLWKYFADVVTHGAGVMVSIVAAACMIGLIAAMLRRNSTIDPAQRWGIVTLLIPAALLVVSQAMSINHSPRLLTPAFFCLAAVAGTGLAYVAPLRRPQVVVGFAILLAMQAILFVMPRNVSAALPGARWSTIFLTKSELWDYEPVYAYCQQQGLTSPRIGLLGNGYCFNPAQVRLAWARHGQEVKREQLWRYEKRDFNMEAIVNAARECDVVMTLPGYVGDPGQNQQLDNQYNVEFARILTNDPAFGPPQSFSMGRLESTELLVFINRGK